MDYWTKRRLYNEVDLLVKRLNVSYADYPLKSKQIAFNYCIDLEIKYIDFDGLCGILHRGRKTTMALNSNHDEAQQNFDCMHELIHYFTHRDKNSFQCICADNKSIIQNVSIEWQANEGAAQFLVPYQLFIPKYVDLSRKHAHEVSGGDVNEELAAYFGVSLAVIETRLKNLNYEIYLFLKRENLNVVKLMSLTALKNNKINVDHQKWYCRNCLSTLNDEYAFCPICGEKISGKNFFGRNAYQNWGAGYMNYNGIEVDEKSKALMCPNCGNEQIIPDGDYCKVCGTYLINKCDDTDYQDNDGDMVTQPGCNKLVDGNARYCPYCGNHTTFFNKGFLNEWDEPQDAKGVDEVAATSADADSKDDVNGDVGDFVEIDSDDDLPF